MEKIEYKVETEVLQIAGATESNCNEIIFINKSGAGITVQVDGFPLDNNEFLTDGGNIGEMNKSRYNITASAAAFRLYVRRKIYTK